MPELAKIQLKKVEVKLISSFEEISEITALKGQVYVLPLKATFSIETLLKKLSKNQIKNLILNRSLYRF